MACIRRLQAYGKVKWILSGIISDETLPALPVPKENKINFNNKI